MREEREDFIRSSLLFSEWVIVKITAHNRECNTFRHKDFITMEIPRMVYNITRHSFDLSYENRQTMKKTIENMVLRKAKKYFRETYKKEALENVEVLILETL